MTEALGDRWVFGYGSLVWRPAFPFVERRPGRIHGWARRFWQGSPDHRGTSEAPGRVVTVIDEPRTVLHGRAYRVAADDVPDVLGRLDHREQGGYERHDVDVELTDAAGGHVTALMYVASPQNPSFLGAAPLEEMARHVLSSHGPSGPNLEYVLRLAEALRELGVEDDPTFALEGCLRVMMGGR